MLENMNNYGPYVELVQSKRQIIETNTITHDNWYLHFDSILNIMRDGIELEQFRTSFITVIFADKADVDLSIPDYFYNLIMWILPIKTNQPITCKYLFWEPHVTQKSLKKYIDDNFIAYNRNKIENILLNNIIDDCLSKFPYIDEFSMYLMNTINLEDTIDLMNKYPEFNDLIHTDLSGIPIEDISNIAMNNAYKQIEYIKNSDHCFKDFFNAEEGINPKQFREVFTAIGTKPDGRGGVYPTVISQNYLTGGANNLIGFYIESSTGRVAQIIVKGNVGDSGSFARLLGLNNIDTRLHEDPHYICNTKNFEEIVIKNKSLLHKYENRYYRLNPNGLEYLLTKKDEHLIGKKLYFRSPMTCASAAKGHGICYRCYGELAHTNKDINIGKIAAEEISSKLTQKMLSAKHLLEAFIKALSWTAYFADIFTVDYNAIKILEDFNTHGYKMIINSSEIEVEDILDSESSYESEYNEYITEFEILTPDKKLIPISTDESDKMYLSIELNDAIRHHAKPYDEDKLAIDLNILKEIPLFLVQLHNNELSETLNQIRKTIDNAKEIGRFDRNNWLQELLDTLEKGKLNVQAIHVEIILMNQIRNADSILDVPDWSYPNEDYSLLTLNQALRNNPSLTVSLSSSKISKSMYAPLTFKKNKASFLDLFFMENLNEVLDKDKITINTKKEDIEDIIMPDGLKQAIRFVKKEKKIK